MDYEKTELYFLQKDVLRYFGDEEGQKIFRRAAKLYAELVVTTDYKNSQTLERQLKRLIYPVLAFYKTLLTFGYKVPNALGIVRTETEKAARESASVLANQMRPLFPYRAFRRNIKNFMEYKFPSGGWESAGSAPGGKRFRSRSATACIMRSRINSDAPNCAAYSAITNGSPLPGCARRSSANARARSQTDMNFAISISIRGLAENARKKKRNCNALRQIISGHRKTDVRFRILQNFYALSLLPRTSMILCLTISLTAARASPRYWRGSK